MRQKMRIHPTNGLKARPRGFSSTILSVVAHKSPLSAKLVVSPPATMM
jgi:hypothetical protein